MKMKNRQAKLEKRIKAWDALRDKGGGRSGNLAFHKPGSNKK